MDGEDNSNNASANSGLLSAAVGAADSFIATVSAIEMDLQIENDLLQQEILDLQATIGELQTGLETCEGQVVILEAEDRTEALANAAPPPINFRTDFRTDRADSVVRQMQVTAYDRALFQIDQNLPRAPVYLYE